MIHANIWLLAIRQAAYCNKQISEMTIFSDNDLGGESVKWQIHCLCKRKVQSGQIIKCTATDVIIENLLSVKTVNMTN